ncbi:MAG TPA: outer membrane protein assembly factor BamE [Candidatus Krumholzibacteria bacterium]|nr:outer membrane protein assembly factor BamE [Candidatus Krumholzibacteria bacterium]
MTSTPVRLCAMVLALPLCLALLSGCATVGWEFPVANVDKIVIGQTTRDEVQKLFGNPWRVGVEDGHETWTYGHYKYKVFGQSKSRDLLVRFNEKNIVRSYTFNTTEKEDRPQKP